LRLEKRISASILALLVLGLATYIRVAPHQLDHAHDAPHPRGPGDYAFPTGHEAVRAISTSEREAFERAHALVIATPRTTVLRGAGEDLGVTHVTRSQIWGMPDYTSVYVLSGDPSLLVFRATSRFGPTDFGVNRRRIEAWVAELERPPGAVVSALAPE
jgi:hypothetical protein